MIHKQTTLKKYLYCLATNNTIKESFKKSSIERGITGWVASDGQWIKTNSFHACPELLGILTSSESAKKDEVKYLVSKIKNTDMEKQREHISLMKCFSLGAVRVVEKENRVMFTAKNLKRINQAWKVISKIYLDTIFQKNIGPADILNDEGECINVAEYSLDKDKFYVSRNFVYNPFDPNNI